MLCASSLLYRRVRVRETLFETFEANVDSVSAVPEANVDLRERPIEDHIGDGRVPFEEFVELEPAGGGMDLDIAEVQSCVGSGHGARVIAREDPVDLAVHRQGAERSKDAGGGRGPDRADGHRKLIMGASLLSSRERSPSYPNR